ncbi:MAG: hypothetical protein QM692_03535, partial [Thermomicrobiales bacterium]
ALAPVAPRADPAPLATAVSQAARSPAPEPPVAEPSAPPAPPAPAAKAEPIAPSRPAPAPPPAAPPVADDAAPVAADHRAPTIPPEEAPEDVGIWRERDPLPALKMHPRTALPTWEPGAAPLEDVSPVGPARPRRGGWRISRRDALIFTIIGGVWLLGRAGLLPVARQRPRPTAVPTVAPTSPAAAPAVSAAEFRSLQAPLKGDNSDATRALVQFNGDDFTARMANTVLRLAVTQPDGWGIVTFATPPVEGGFIYEVVARPVVGQGELLVTLTDAKTRTIWIWAFDLAARTWSIAQDRQAGRGRQEITEPRSYAAIAAAGEPLTVSLRRRNRYVALSINRMMASTSLLDKLPPFLNPLEPGVGAMMPPETSPEDAQVFWVAVEDARLAHAAAS